MLCFLHFFVNWKLVCECKEINSFYFWRIFPLKLTSHNTYVHFSYMKHFCDTLNCKNQSFTSFWKFSFEWREDHIIPRTGLSKFSFPKLFALTKWIQFSVLSWIPFLNGSKRPTARFHISAANQNNRNFLITKNYNWLI